MIKYLLVLTGIYIFSYLDISKNNIKFMNFYLISILTLFAGLRSNTPDYSNYKRIYEAAPYSIKDIPIAMNKFEMEIGYFLLNTIWKNIYDNFEAFIFLLAFISIILILNSLKKMSRFPFVTLMVYFSYLFINYPMAQIRNGLALGIIMNAIAIMKKINFFHYSIYIIIASFFHISSIIFLPLYFLKYIKFSKIKSFFILTLILISSVVNFREITKKIIEFFSYNNLFMNKLYLYLDSNRFPKSDFSIRLFFAFLIAFIAIIFSKKLRSKMENYDIFIGFLFIYLFFRVGVLSSSIFIRISNLFMFSQIIFLSSFLILFRNVFSKFIYLNLLYIYSVISTINLLQSHSRFLDYNFIKYFDF